MLLVLSEDFIDRIVTMINENDFKSPNVRNVWNRLHNIIEFATFTEAIGQLNSHASQSTLTKFVPI